MAARQSDRTGASNMSNLSKRKLGSAYERPTQARLQELLEYSPETGELRWLKRRKGVPYDGAPAGCKSGDGYLKVSVDGTQHRAHQLIWCYVTGEWCEFIDHADTDGLNNRWLNLRKSTVTENNRNVNNKKKPTSPSPLKGAYLDKRRDKWHSRIVVDHSTKFLGFFDTAEEAHAAYVRAATELHGDFARIT